LAAWAGCPGSGAGRPTGLSCCQKRVEDRQPPEWGGNTHSATQSRSTPGMQRCTGERGFGLPRRCSAGMLLRAHHVSPAPPHIIGMVAEPRSASPGPMHVWQTSLWDITIWFRGILHVLTLSPIWGVAFLLYINPDVSGTPSARPCSLCNEEREPHRRC
jgi:hypothetical protein